jgi:hypothetical protein
MANQRVTKDPKAEKAKKPTNQVKDMDKTDSDGEEELENCANCGKTVLATHRALQCDMCGYWHHISCEKISEEIYTFLSKHDEPTLNWCCRKCTLVFRRVFGAVAGLENADSRLDERFTAMEKKIDMVMTNCKMEVVEEKFDTVMQTLKKNTIDVAAMQDCVGGVLKEQLKEDKEEEFRKSSRKTNVIVHGIAESKAAKVEDKCKEDDDQVQLMLHKMSCDDVSVKQVTRLGGIQTGLDARARPVRLILETEAAKNMVLQKAKNLHYQKDGGWNTVFVHQDLTPKEREKRRALVREIKELGNGRSKSDHCRRKDSGKKKYD